MLTLNQIFQNYQKISPMPQAEWDRVASLFQLKTLDKKELFIKDGEIPTHFGLVAQGFFRIYYRSHEGKEWVKAFRGPGGLVGTYAEILQKIPARTFVQALIPSSVYLVAVKDFFEMVNGRLYWEMFLKTIAENHFIQKENREYQFLKFSAAERYKAFQEEYKEMENDIPLFYIASYLGITPQALSRLRKS
jgi:CRP-like cAMP-binding protein